MKILVELQGTASETVLVALLAAQARVMAERPAEDRQRLVCYSSNQVRFLPQLTAMPAVPAIEHTHSAKT